MTKNNENQSMVNNSTHTLTSAHDTRESFVAFIGQNYPQIYSVKFKRKKHYRSVFYEIHANCKPRRLWARGKTVEEAMKWFFVEIQNKVLEA